MEAIAAAHFLRNARRAGVTLLALVLVWRVVVGGSGPLLEGSGSADPDRALAPLAVGAPDIQWRARLARNPTDYPALVILALQLERQGKAAEAAEAMRAALRLAPADERALLEAAGFHLRSGDEFQALTILRRAEELNPSAAGATWPVFTAALDGGRRDRFFVDAARDSPQWWPMFFAYACKAGRDSDALQRVFAIRAAQGNVSARERSCLIERLQRENRWAQAYQSWINSLPLEQRGRIGYVFNGDFEAPISNVGFDWVIAVQDGVHVDTQSIQGAQGRRALRVEFVRKRWAGSPVQQILLLVPGKYRFEGRGRADGLDSWVGVQWALHCLQADNSAPRQLARSDRFRGTSEWVSFHDDFVVTRDCPIQVLRLELANPRQDVATTENVATRLNGNIWFDDFRVRNLD